MKWLRRTGTAIVVIAVIYATALAGFAYAMRQPFDRFAMLMAKVGPVPFLLFPFETMWRSARAGTLQVGDTAPDFTLPLLDHAGKVTLASLNGVSPVVLVFGSYM